MNLATLLAERKENPDAWRYTDLAKLVAPSYGPAPNPKDVTLPEAVSPVRMIFVNGHFRADLSQVEALPPGFLSVDENGDCHMCVAPQTCLALQPLGILCFNEATGPAWEHSGKLYLSLGENSRLTMLEKHFSYGPGAHAALPHMEIALARQSKLVHGKIVVGSEAGLHLARSIVTVAAGAFYDYFALVKDGLLTRCELTTRLQGELAGVHLHGVSLLRGKAKAERHASVLHEAPHGVSRQEFKSVLDDKAQGIFHGKIHVARAAQKTDGHQLSRALVLSDKAEMDAQPELEIYADDVKCSHGSAIGDLSEQELFYLRSRGIEESEARALLIEAFVEDLVDQIQSPDIAAVVRKEVGLWLKKN